MADRQSTPPIIVVKKHAGKHAAHHGGAWKIAYADFVTAMMAFFLLLWLLSTTTEKQREGIGSFFNSVPLSESGSFGLLRGRAIDAKDNQPAAPNPVIGKPITRPATPGNTETESETAAAAARDAEAQTFDQVEGRLRDALRGLPELANNVLMERTEEGLRIQLVDQERSPMFASGSASLVPHMDQLLRVVASLIGRLPNPIAISGHTDARPFARGDYTNWELSADRANAARRTLVAAGTADARFAKVLGLADRQPLEQADPAAATNRRISILLMSQLNPSERF